MASARRRAGRQSRGRAYQGVRAVGPEQDARPVRLVDPYAGGVHRDVADPVAAQHGPGPHGVLHQPGVEHLAGDDPDRAGQGPVDGAGAAPELQALQGGPAVHHVGGAHRGQRVDDVRGDAVPAGLVAGEVGAVEQQHPQARVGGQRAQRGARPGGPGPDDDEVPGPVRGVVPGGWDGALVWLHVGVPFLAVEVSRS